MCVFVCFSQKKGEIRENQGSLKRSDKSEKSDRSDESDRSDFWNYI